MSQFIVTVIIALACLSNLHSGFDESKYINHKTEFEFIENKGQFTSREGNPAEEVLFYAMGRNTQVYVRREGFSFVFSKVISEEILPDPSEFDDERQVVRTVRYYRADLDFANSNQSVNIDGSDKSPYFTNYFKSGGHYSGVASYGKIIYNDIYPDIDLVLYTEPGGGLEYDFIIKPGGNPGQIELKFTGSDRPYINPAGGLISKNELGRITQSPPYSYQIQDSRQIKISSKFIIENDGRIGFRVGDYDNTKPLIIDPITRLWGTLYGGMEYEEALDVALDSDGNLYVAGISNSENQDNYIATTGAHQVTYAGASYAGAGDAMLVKFNSSGERIWGTYFGGTNDEVAYGVDVDGSGNVYLTGYTKSTTGISTAGAYQTTFGGNTDAFAAKFNSSGALQWATYFGGGGNDKAYGIDVTSSGDVYISGRTSSQSGIASPEAYQTTFGGGFGSDAFIAKFNSSGQRQWSSYYGGGETDYSYDCAAAGNGDVYITGLTFSPNSIASAGAHQTVYSGGGSDAFLVKFDSSGDRLWGTYYGGGGDAGEQGYGISTDTVGNVYFCGKTSSGGANVIATAGTHQPNYNDGDMPFPSDGYVVKFDSSGTRIWGTYYGGDRNDVVDDVFADSQGNVYGFGSTQSNNAIASEGAFKSNNTFGGYFVFKLSGNGQRDWGTYYGCCSLDRRYQGSIIADNSGNVYFASMASDEEDFVSSGAYQEELRGEMDAFVAKMGDLSLATNISGEFCAGDSIDIQVAVASLTNANFNTGNIFTAQLSDTAGSFANPVDIGILQSVSSGNINAVLPINSVSGTSYRIRLISTSPSLISNDNGSDITINELPAALISGNNTACKNMQFEYSTESKADYQYNWSVDGGEIIGPANASAIEIWWGDGDKGGITLEVSDSRSGCSNSTSRTISLFETPSPEISGSNMVCKGAVAHYNANQGQFAYSWSVEGGSIMGDENGSSVAVFWNQPGEGYVRLIQQTIGSDCKDSVQMNITISPLPEPEITGAEEICLNRQSTYSSANDSSGTDKYLSKWSAIGGSIIGPDTGRQVDVLWDKLGRGRVKLIQRDLETGCSDSVEFDVEIKPLPEIAIIGTFKVCSGCVERYSTLFNPAYVYSWTVEGGEVTDNSEPNEIEVKWGEEAAGSLRLTIRNELGCEDSLLISIIIGNGPVVVISGDFKVCENDIRTYSTSTNPDLENLWTVDGGVILSGAGASNAEVQWGQAGIGTIKLNQKFISTGFTDSVTKEVAIRPLPPKPVITRVGDNLESNSEKGNQWLFNGERLAGEEGKSYTPQESGKYSVMVTSEYGCQSELSDEYDFIITGVGSEELSDAIRIYPNPASDKLIIEIQSDNPGKISMDIVSMYGRTIISQDNNIGNKFEINLGGFASGIYLLRIRISGVIITKKFQIRR